MSDLFHDRLESELVSLRSKHLFRSIPDSASHLVNFSSNDYLGLAENAELRERVLARAASLALSASSSRLLPGNLEEHAKVESDFAAFLDAPSALLFNSGYAANVALLSTLASRHDLILYDERCHASWYDGLQTTNAASFKFRHNDIEHLEKLIDQHSTKHKTIFIVIESIYSMDGDAAQLESFAALAAQRDVILIVDEAHATGICGERGEGMVGTLSLRSRNVITVHPCGKALASAGAIVAAEAGIMDYLINRSRGFIYSTALPPIVAVQIQEVLKMLREHGAEMISDLHAKAAFVRERLRNGFHRWTVPVGGSPIIPVIVGSEQTCLNASAFLRSEGYVVAAIRPPTVPLGTSRLRLIVNRLHSQEQLERVIALILEAESKSREDVSA